MASGLGKRFGSDKLMADFGRKPMIARILDTTDRLFENRVVVTRSEGVKSYCESKGINTVFHSFPGRNDAIRLGLQALGDKLDGYIFCLGDQPLVSGTSIERMLDATNGLEYILRLAYNETYGSPVYFPRWAYEELMELPEGKGGQVVVKNHIDRVRMVEADYEYELEDIDTLDDYKRMLSLLENIKGEA